LREPFSIVPIEAYFVRTLHFNNVALLLGISKLNMRSCPTRCTKVPNEVLLAQTDQEEQRGSESLPTPKVELRFMSLNELRFASYHYAALRFASLKK